MYQIAERLRFRIASVKVDGEILRIQLDVILTQCEGFKARVAENEVEPRGKDDSLRPFKFGGYMSFTTAYT